MNFNLAKRNANQTALAPHLYYGRIEARQILWVLNLFWIYGYFHPCHYFEKHESVLNTELYIAINKLKF